MAEPVRKLAAEPDSVLTRLTHVDRAVYQALARQYTPQLDLWMRRLSHSANWSSLWMATAAFVAVTGGRPGRRAAAAGLVSVACTSALVNVGVKAVPRRPRPDRDATGMPLTRQVPMPASSSFPSGHAASAFAFATAAGREFPVAAGPLAVLAAAVAYSRVHAGVHYPGDVLAGTVIGIAMGQVVSRAIDRRRRRRPRRAPA